MGQKDHNEFIRKGADLYVKRDITLSEALTGYTLEVKHLDDRKLLIKSKAGEVTKPLLKDPLQAEASDQEFDCFENCDTTCEAVAQAETEDTDMCKNVCKKKDFSCFVIKNGTATFKQGTRTEIMEGKKAGAGSTMYVVKDPNSDAGARLCKAVKGEGMPMHKNPFVCGNMFIILNIQFPEELNDAAKKALKKALTQEPLNIPTVSEDGDGVETHFLTDMDPVASFKEGAPTKGGDAYDEDEEGGGGPGGQRVQCNQQ